ncbi:MAG: hypothetical protein JWP31_187 [Aeromicrobium sp.]|nr:hypothetical protein [Aeromicrobium sp.]
MPAAAVALLVRGITRVRPRFGSLVMAGVFLSGSVLAVVLFVAYPQAV